jgi:imidazolonepropionase-like amidohydrolase
VIRLLLATAIVSATVHTAEGPPLESATVVIDGERIAAVGAGVPVPRGARVIDARGAVVTPGLVDAASRVGLVEIPGDPAGIEGTTPATEPIRAALRADDAFNPSSLAIPVARAGGVTSVVAMPAGGVISGQSAWVDLVEQKPVRRAPLALHVAIATGEQPGARSEAWRKLREALVDARLYRSNRGPFIARRLRPLAVTAADVEPLARALEGELPVVFEVDAESDIRTALRIADEFRLRAVLLGAVEGWRAAEAIARARVPVLIDPFENLPASLVAPRARSDNALLLAQAGAQVALTLRGETHLAHRLRQAAGNAVATGFAWDDALAAITRVPCDVFGVSDAGRLRRGALANVVVWNGDPLEVTTWATHVFVRGEEQPLRTRQDALAERYGAPAR